MEQANPKSLFENVSGGVVGAVKLDHKGEPKGIAVPFKGQVWLSEEEQVLTANAPRNEADNPFLPGKEKLKLIRKATDLGRERPIGDEQPSSEPEAPAEPAGSPEGDQGAEQAAGGDNAPNPPAEEQAAQSPPPPPPTGSPVANAETVRPGPLTAGNPGNEAPAAAAAPTPPAPAAATPPAPAPKQAAKAPPAAQPKAPAE